MYRSKFAAWAAVPVVTAVLSVMSCAAAAQPRSAKADPAPPALRDCGIVSIGSPSKYICHGKVYTAYQLQHLREKAAAQAGAAKAGGMTRDN
jgi:hypothetical protein